MQIHILTVIEETPFGPRPVVCRKPYGRSFAVYADKDHAQARLEDLSSRHSREYQIITVDVDDTKLREKHRRATKHIQQLVTHPITSEITGKMHMRLRSAETALGWTQAHVADLRRHNTALNQSLNWALAALAASWVFFIAITFGVLPL